MFRRLTITIGDLTFQRLLELADRERRPTREQAAVLVEHALRARGLPRRGVQDQVDAPRPMASA